jgi:hypothetical protein
MLVSTQDDPGACTWMDDQVFAVELKPGWRVVRLTHNDVLVPGHFLKSFEHWM